MFVYLLPDHRNIFNHNSDYDVYTIWNELPGDNRSATSLIPFRSEVKFYLFYQSYPPYFLFFLVVFGHADSLHVPRYMIFWTWETGFLTL